MPKSKIRKPRNDGPKTDKARAKAVKKAKAKRVAALNAAAMAPHPAPSAASLPLDLDTQTPAPVVDPSVNSWCAVCNKTFSSPSVLRRHEKSASHVAALALANSESPS